MKAMLASGKVQFTWKHSKAIILFKKVDNNNVKSWRPMSFMLALYGIVMGYVSKVA